MNKHHNVFGFSLIEVLVSVFVFSIGLLGIAGMQLASLRMKGDSLYRAQAEMLAADMADRMRTNLNQAELGTASPYNNAAGASTANPNCLGLDSTGAPTSSSCSPSQLAQNDFYEWNSAIGGGRSHRLGPCGASCAAQWIRNRMHRQHPL